MVAKRPRKLARHASVWSRAKRIPASWRDAGFPLSLQDAFNLAGALGCSGHPPLFTAANTGAPCIAHPASSHPLIQPSTHPTIHSSNHPATLDLPASPRRSELGVECFGDTSFPSFPSVQFRSNPRPDHVAGRQDGGWSMPFSPQPLAFSL